VTGTWNVISNLLGTFRAGTFKQFIGGETINFTGSNNTNTVLTSFNQLVEMSASNTIRPSLFSDAETLWAAATIGSVAANT